MRESQRLRCDLQMCEAIHVSAKRHLVLAIEFARPCAAAA